MFRNKIKEEKGGIGLGIALAIPMILLIMFLAVDLIQVQVRKTSIQRTLDSAALAVISQATGKEYYTDNAASSGSHTSRPFGEVFGQPIGDEVGTRISE